MLYFKTRQQARNFAKGKKQVHDLGKDRAETNHRWDVRTGNVGI